jgi:hypothetical protein
MVFKQNHAHRLHHPHSSRGSPELFGGELLAVDGTSPTLRRAEPASRGKVITADAQSKRLYGHPGAFGFAGFGQTFLIDTE